MELIIIGALGALAAILANKSIAVFNDGFRPIVGSYIKKSIDRKTLAATSFALSFGLVIGFGLPFSIGKSIILIHSILLATDLIVVILPKGKKGLIASGIVGGAFGIVLSLGLDAIVDLFEKLPYNFLPHLSSVGQPVLIGFTIFPALAVALQHGFKKGVITGGATLLAVVLVAKFGTFDLNGNKVVLSKEGIGLLVGVVLMIVFAIKSSEKTNTNKNLLGIFGENVSRIRKN